MTSERIKEIQQQTAYPNSVSVQQALLQVWNECSASSQTENIYTETEELLIKEKDSLLQYRSGRYFDGILQEAKEKKEQENNMQDRELALFLRWLLKHYSTETTDDGFFYWADSMGIEVLPETIINDYKSEQ